MNPIIICLTATAGSSVHVRAAGSLALLVLLGASTRLAAGACLHVRAAGGLRFWCFVVPAPDLRREPPILRREPPTLRTFDII